MVFGVLSICFSTLELRKLICERLIFKIQLKIEFLWPYNEKMVQYFPGYIAYEPSLLSRNLSTGDLYFQNREKER